MFKNENEFYKFKNIVNIARIGNKTIKPKDELKTGFFLEINYKDYKDDIHLSHFTVHANTLDDAVKKIVETLKINGCNLVNVIYSETCHIIS